MTRKIYLAVWYDKHDDDDYVAFEDKQKAIDQCWDWAKNAYGERYNFSSPDGHNGFEFYLSSNVDDGPHMLVEEINLT